MARLMTISGLAAAMTFAIFAVATNATPSDARDGTRFRCKAKGSHETSLQGKYEERARPGRTRQKFNAEFEALPGGAYSARQEVNFFVDSVKVGSMPLKLVQGELTAELELDTNDAGAKKPIPPNFPDVESGTVVEAVIGGKTVLGCELNRD